MNQPNPNNSSKVILVVEDSPVQALALVKLLEREGLNVLCAANGQSGLSMARCYIPDLIILDVQMPEMDGLEACHLLKQDPKTKKIPVILFTAHTEPEILKSGLDEGAVDYIPKDAFSDIVLLETLRQLNFLPQEEINGLDTDSDVELYH